jgi:hypothetical protein
MAADPNIPEIVRRYLAGESVQEIAVDEAVTGGRKVTRRTIYRWMLGGVGDEKYGELVTEALVNRVADADDDLDEARTARDPIAMAAARETARFARMDFERRRPALYGPKQEVNHRGAAPTLMVVLSSEGGGRVLEGTQVPDQLPAPVGAGLEQGDADGLRQG